MRLRVEKIYQRTIIPYDYWRSTTVNCVYTAATRGGDEFNSRRGGELVPWDHFHPKKSGKRNKESIPPGRGSNFLACAAWLMRGQVGDREQKERGKQERKEQSETRFATLVECVSGAPPHSSDQ